MRIDGTAIEERELSAEYHRLVESQGDRPDALRLSEDQLREMATENVINRFLLVREARRRFPTVKVDEIRRRAKQLQERYGTGFDPSRFQAEMEDDVRVEKLVRAASAGIPSVTEEEARAEYESDPTAWAEPERVHASHIVRHTFGGANPGRALDQIMEAQKRLKAGEPFETVARAFSDQYGQAGDLGTFARGAMVEKFEKVAFRQKPGTVSDVFQTEFGYHLALVHERIPAKERSFEEARADIVRSIRERREREAFNELVASLREAATIERDA